MRRPAALLALDAAARDAAALRALRAGRRRGRRRARGARSAASRDVLTFDMGGTTTDVAPIVGGELRLDARERSSPASRSRCRRSTSTRSAPAAARSPGSTPAARCASGRERRRAARARPPTGAAARSRRSPTRNLAARPPRDGALLGGEVPLDRGRRAEASLAAARRRRSARDVRDGRARASSRWPTPRWRARCARITVERGLDPRDFALVAFGGAGPLHACALAEELGMRDRARAARQRRAERARPRAVSDERRDHAAPAPARRRADAEAASAALAAAGARRDLDGATLRRRWADAALPRPGVRADACRPTTSDASPERFARGPRAPLRLRRSDEPVRGRAAARHRRARRRSAGAGGGPGRAARPSRGRRRVRVAGVEVDAPVLDRGAARRAAPRCAGRPSWSSTAHLPGARRAGPAASTTPARWCSPGGRVTSTRHALGPRQRARGHRRGDGRRARARRLLAEHQRAARLLGGAVRRRRADGRAGRAHPRAPRRDARRGARRCARRDPRPGDVFLLNDPFRGGSHLPDLTLVSPIDVRTRATVHRLRRRRARTTPTSAA